MLREWAYLVEIGLEGKVFDVYTQLLVLLCVLLYCDMKDICQAPLPLWTKLTHHTFLTMMD